MVRRVVTLGLVWLLCFGVYRFCYKQTDGFHLSKIQSTLPFDPAWSVTPLNEREDEKIRKILNQPFTYLSKGAQSYVFESQDKEYVIKFFRVSHIEAPRWLTSLWLPRSLENWRKEKIGIKEAKRIKDFTSYKMAYEEMQEESGLLYIHLNKTDKTDSVLGHKATLFDKIGIKHTVDLDKMEFMVQKKATLFYPTLEKWLAAGQKEKVQKGIEQLLELFSKRRALKIADKDPDLKSNFGFIGEKPIQFDMGRFKRGENSSKKNESLRDEMIRLTDELKLWLKKRDPVLAEELEQKVLACSEK